ncbi:GNAT family N-acetyltransferase [Campylobacter corcagiensis]|uniref:GNAT family N-acetyltransferase n=1 Tax=Campylobacter corcagiensis TaxID=1448857 RepID=A0A7M1LJL6_9BACT|nr:N-acetyltransferase [Campylobacter corcagiensis]QKF65418.1 ribosomal-protein-S18-alanine N-acetyltransferase [Campylobacter corcagiensis]QOQ88006.1 GNAT family N-acetyltransferase [Campylobacter corcagiensis]
MRKATNADVNALLKIEEESFSEFKLSRASFYYHIKRNFLVVYEKNGEILGYALVFTYLKTPRIYSIAVSKSSRNLGVGSEILNYLTTKFNSLRLEVRSDNKTAINLYKKFGFKVIKILPNYYENCDGLKMKFQNMKCKNLNNS